MKILFVIDMQKDFVDGALGTKEAIDIVHRVVKKILENRNNPVIASYDTHYDNYLETLEGKKLPVPHCIEGTNGWNLNDEVKNALLSCRKVSHRVKKTFGYTKWDSVIEGLGVRLENIDEIEICGLCTDICVISNALILRALFPNVKITIDSTCCAGTSIETHNASLVVAKMNQIDVI